MYKKTHIHFIGVGGIGMSAIATILQLNGYTTSGCDSDTNQSSIQKLRELGCTINKSNSTSCCMKVFDILVYSSAINPDHPEIAYAKSQNIPTIPRALMLAELMRTKFSIAIAGSHGKTTTSSMLSHILIEAHTDPTVIVGGIIENFSNNARTGSGKFLVTEADESDKSLLHLSPALALITNIDLEHLDCYANINEIKHTFLSFLSNLPFYGSAFICTDDKHSRSLLLLRQTNTIRFGTNIDETDICAININIGAHSSQFSLYSTEKQENLGIITVPMPGMHNVLNALGACAIAYHLEIPVTDIAKAIATFKGVDRRFSFKGLYKNALLYDDYGHHPTEIHHTLTAARKSTKGKLIVLFQPHRFSRTQKLWNNFVEVLSSDSIDTLIITDIYRASEEPIDHITSNNLVEDIKVKNTNRHIEYIPEDERFEQVKQKLDSIITEGDLVLFLGAGKINQLIQRLGQNS